MKFLILSLLICFGSYIYAACRSRAAVLLECADWHSPENSEDSEHWICHESIDNKCIEGDGVYYECKTPGREFKICETYFNESLSKIPTKTSKEPTGTTSPKAAK